MEYNPSEEIGLRNETQLFMSCSGVLTSNDSVRDLCKYVIRNGDQFHDVVSRYFDITTNALGRDDEKYGTAVKMMIPFLKAFGLTDFAAYSEAKKNLTLIPYADSCLMYLNSLMPTFINTGILEHQAMALCDITGFPSSNISCTKVEFDSEDSDRQECRALRDFANSISTLRVPKTKYTFEEGEILSDEDATIVNRLDEIFLDEIPKMKIYEDFKDVLSIGTREKSYSALEIRRNTSIEFDSTAYIGSSMTDHIAMDLVRDSSGLAISFNGCEYAVRNSNVAVMCNDAIVNTVLVTEFYDKGIESVFEMIDNWDRKGLEEHPCADRNLMNEMLRRFPKKLPNVKRVDRHNVDDIVAESEAYRKKVEECNRRY